MPRNSLYVLMILLLVTGMIFTWWRWGHDHHNIPKDSEHTGNLEHRKRIDGLIDQLKLETLDGSIAELPESQQYTYPNYFTPRKWLKVDFERMLSARRSIKVLSEVEQLSDELRTAKCQELFDLCFQKNVEKHSALMDRIEDTSNSDEERLWEDTRLPLCLAMYITAKYAPVKHLENQLTRLEEFRGVIEERLDRKQDCYDDNQGRVILDYCIPSPRAQMNVLLEASRRIPDDGGMQSKIDLLCKDFIKREIPIVAWDAYNTWFDVPTDLGDIPINRSSEMFFTCVAYEWPTTIVLDDEKQDEIVQQIRDIVFPYTPTE